MSRPTQKQIKEEIAKLREMKPTVLQFSKFGDDHHAGIEAQIEVLENDMDDTDIDEKEDEEDWTSGEVENARQACDWLNGVSQDGPPSEGWKTLVRK